MGRISKVGASTYIVKNSGRLGTGGFPFPWNDLIYSRSLWKISTLRSRQMRGEKEFGSSRPEVTLIDTQTEGNIVVKGLSSLDEAMA